ncbi:MAG: hypothetical protein AAF629_30265, partial [Chloroflexota bacterium]
INLNPNSVDFRGYAYLINTDRREYKLTRYSNNAIVDLTDDWHRTSSIDPDPLAVNQLKIIRYNQYIYLFINGDLVNGFVDQELATGRAGLTVLAYDEVSAPQADVRFDNYALHFCDNTQQKIDLDERPATPRTGRADRPQ